MEGSPETGIKEAKEEQVLTPEMKEQVRLARRCFTQVERLSTLMASYPPGHPTVVSANEGLADAFREYFEITDRLTVQVHPHWMDLYGSGEVVWETEDPKDYCFSLSRDGVYLLHILAGVDTSELQRLVQVLNDLVTQSIGGPDAVTMLFDAGFRYISWEAIDESLAALAGVESNANNRDTPEEQEMIEELFSDAFDKEFSDEEQKKTGGDQDFDAEFEIRLQRRSQQYMKLDVGSRHFLMLSEEAQEYLLELKKGFTEHNELEHRQGEVLSAVLGARPKRKLRKGAVHQIGNVMGMLLETEQPWEALSFLKLIHHWRDKFQPEVAGELKDIVKESFTPRRVQLLVKKASTSDKGARRAILQMFNALHLDDASQGLAELMAWDIDEEAREDILRYIRLQARKDLSFLEAALPQIPADKAAPLLQIIIAAMPRSRPILVRLIQSEVEPPTKVLALRALRGTWEDPTEVRDALVPLVSVSHSNLKVTAAESLAEAAPQHVFRVLEPMFTPKLAKRPDDEVAELVRILVKASGTKAVNKLQELVQRRGIVSEEDQELAVTVVRALIKSPTPAIMKLLKEVAGDWLVAGRIRSTCKEIVELLERD